MTVRLTLAALLLGGMAMGPAGRAEDDPKKPAEEKKPSALEELIAQALRDNPDVRVGEAKVQEAEAELNRARLQVIQKVVAHQHTAETLTSAVKKAEAAYTVAQTELSRLEEDYAGAQKQTTDPTVPRLVNLRGAIEQARGKVETAKAALQAAKADLAKTQAELPYLLGKGAKEDKQAEATKRALEWLGKQQAGDENATARLLYAHSIMQAEAAWKAAQPQGTIADKLRKALDTSIKLKIEDDTPLGDVLDYLHNLTGVPMVTTLPRDTKLPRINIENVSLGAAFQCVEDVGKVQFGVRDYGILVSDKLPSNVTRLHDFWKGGDKPKAGDEKPRPSGHNPPPGKVEGEITDVGEGGGLAEFRVGQDAELEKGQTLEVYRHVQGKEYKYLGTLRVERVGVPKAGHGVGKFVNKLNAPVKVGDRVSSLFFVD
jgi:hypothetical protein